MELTLPQIMHTPPARGSSVCPGQRRREANKSGNKKHANFTETKKLSKNSRLSFKITVKTTFFSPPLQKSRRIKNKLIKIKKKGLS